MSFTCTNLLNEINTLEKLSRENMDPSSGNIENMDPSSGKNIIFSFIRMPRRNFYFFFVRISVVVWINFLFSPFLKHVYQASCWIHPGSPCCPLTLLAHLHFLCPNKKGKKTKRSLKILFKARATIHTVCYIVS
jgi:hypothetical protein